MIQNLVTQKEDANFNSEFESRWATNGIALRTLLAYRVVLLSAIHLLLFCLAYAMAFAIRFDLVIPEHYRIAFWVTMPAVVSTKLAVFFLSGQLHGWWRIVTFRDMIAISLTCLASLSLFAAAAFFSNSLSIPGSVVILDAVLTMVIVGGLRSSCRVFLEMVRPQLVSDQYTPAIMIGTDPETVFLAGQIQSYGRLPMRICGLVSATSTPHPRLMGGFAVLGTLDQIDKIVRSQAIHTVLVHTDLLSGKTMRKLMDVCRDLNVKLQIVPRFEQRMHGNGMIPTRDINIDDLLGRQPAELDLENIRELIEGQRVLVTGAGGSIGSEICRQLIRFSPELLVLLGRGENRIYQIEQELLSRRGTTKLETVIADIRDRSRIDDVFAEFSPQVVFHAAAHKHVPLMERNVREAVVNNITGTQNVADAADKYETSRFVMISSDKAVRPTSVMGATKRVAELYIQSIATRSAARFMTVRFGNVLGSAGSVVPLFKRQIRDGGPLTITDEKMTRFFMTIPEASKLVLQAASMGHGGDLFVLDMGTPIRIVDLARDMIRLSGLPEGAIEIVYSGIRPGEKLYEELADNEGEISQTDHPKIMSIQPLEYSNGALQELIRQLTSQRTSVAEIRRLLMSLDRQQEFEPELTTEVLV
ncbi:UDP-N-acetyl-alpha-D-glucosamine C6 dehydratase [Novipirellula aureliae]|uniref:UDP-N-acetyl-alpha-D-glucosamine C6 dehydratase n=1 Tax=Novipirellula aureliae TaxID=2527966 RepID=A0A5C6DY10_9BACT|nr:nucleoside-diphosphate sugar epimerase/dehydratase [Novipirellula aureliae]TWU41305.1 UDP-N-acetyl-alpha-D-glucosamine C6 dehydratase [Novipirellula aureliae]